MAIATLPLVAAGATSAAKAAPSFATVASAASLAAAGVGAVAAVQQGNAQAAAAKFHSEVARQQAEREREAAGIRAEQFRREGSRVLAAARARRAASGISLEGSPLLVDEGTAAEIDYNARLIAAGGDIRASRLEQQAAFGQTRASSARTAGGLRAGTTLLTGLGQVSFGGEKPQKAPKAQAGLGQVSFGG